jgi:hypothetical protein
MGEAVRYADSFLDQRGRAMLKLFSALVGLSMLGLVGVASAAEPLSDAQLDSVVGGLLNVNVGTGAGQIGLVNAAAIPIGVGVVSIL